MVIHSSKASEYYYPSLLDKSIFDDELEHEISMSVSNEYESSDLNYGLKRTRADIEERCRQLKHSLRQQQLREKIRFRRDSIENFGADGFASNPYDMEEKGNEDSNHEDYHEIYIRKSNAFDENDDDSYTLEDDFNVNLFLDVPDDEDKENQPPISI